ncbi:HMG box domain-containing protein [Mycena kentingensis (nom. inval.)]|nr:HMG box domain-containing protein [Mycena kentingensis (nom. inval.)]
MDASDLKVETPRAIICDDDDFDSFVLPAGVDRTKKIPRPPNAFILFRSDLLKNKNVKEGGPQQQQILSKVAGEAWRMSTEAEKDVWRGLAREQAEQHRKEYPDYAFKPARRSKKSKLRQSGEDGPDMVRSWREALFGDKFKGPCPLPSRKAKEVEKAANAQPLPEPVQLPLPIAPTPIYDAPFHGFSWTAAPTNGAADMAISPHAAVPGPLAPDCFDPRVLPPFPPPSLSLYDNSTPSLPSEFPQRGFAHYDLPRRPSTATGMPAADAPRTDIGARLERPASAAGYSRDILFNHANVFSASMPSSPTIHANYDGNFAFMDQTFGDLGSLEFINPGLTTFPNEWSQTP